MSLLIPVAVVSGLGLFFGLGLSYASKVFEVKVDERIGQVREMLPGANCGACGFSGCDGLAEAIVNGEATPNRCPVGGMSMVEAISKFMGIDAGSVEPKEARVMCNGTCDNAERKYTYFGIEDCHSANALAGGMNSCSYSCLGLGSCRKVCPFDAIEVENGVARNISEKCTGCGKCVAECPKGIIRLVPVTSGFTVFCSNQDKGAVARKNCKVACIACRKCEKACPSSAITVENNLAVIDPEKCINCGECEKVCPQSCISNAKAKCFA
ncbi:MAG: RnfABCDGE type electron transport complex subunit B [Clostridiaceae bacterium]|nr:RnfABCDGE type electron transport complex subunit B [Clostridiaceae bacterium]